jgi:RNA polymerase sigma factor (sigma-70 family)
MNPETNAPLHEVRYPDDLELAEAALEGDAGAVGNVKGLLQGSSLKGWLVRRGASGTEAEDLLADLFTDCFGGEKAKGGVHRLLGKFNGGCKLESFLRRVALNRLIGLKRKAKPTVSIEGDTDDEDGPSQGERLAAPAVVVSEDAVVDVLREAVLGAFANVDQEKFVLFRLAHSYRLSQKKIGEMWGWHASKVSRNLSALGEELRESILAKVREADPWLELEWVDFLELCGETIDLFDY